MSQDDFRDFVVNDKITFLGENLLMRIINCTNTTCLKHLGRSNLSKEEAIVFLERCKGLLNKKIQWLSEAQCPDKL